MEDINFSDSEVERFATAAGLGVLLPETFRGLEEPKDRSMARSTDSRLSKPELRIISPTLPTVSMELNIVAVMGSCSVMLSLLLIRQGRGVKRCPCLEKKLLWGERQRTHAVFSRRECRVVIGSNVFFCLSVDGQIK